MNPKILNYQEGIYNSNPEPLNHEDERDINITITSIIRFKRDSETFGFQITLKYVTDDTEIMNFGFIVKVIVPGWIPLTSSDKIDMTSKEQESRSIREIIFSRASDQIKDVCHTMIDFTHGAMAAKSANTFKPSLVFPDINMSDFIETINFRMV